MTDNNVQNMEAEALEVHEAERSHVEGRRDRENNGQGSELIEPKTYDEAAERVHRAFCSPDHEMVSYWDQEMADALRRNGYIITRSTSAESLDVPCRHCGSAEHIQQYARFSRATPAETHNHRFDVVIRDDAYMRLLGCSNQPLPDGTQCPEVYQWDR